MQRSSAGVLEFDAVKEMLRAYTSSPLGRGELERLRPQADREWIEREQQRTRELQAFWRGGGRFEFHGLESPGDLLGKTQIKGSALEIDELRQLLTLADRAAQWREIGMQAPVFLNDGWPAIMELSRALADFRPLLGYFKNKIDPDGRLADSASPELARLRREIDRQKRSIQESLRGHLRRLAEGGAVQDELITIRGERFVIPVKVEQKNRVKGVVHGASSSGQTVYVEPMETIEQNNELVRMLDEEMAEVHRILVEMTAKLGESAGALGVAARVLGELEFAFAKARFAEDYGGVSPKFGARLALKAARHPVLERNLRLKDAHMVPITLEFAEGDRQLIISGPNTGGKTVALKTVGLLSLMAQAGVPVPADEAELPVFDGVLADIGDYQSIEQNLSTFSAHVTNIDRMSRAATAESLVLLDELGSATDPEEGAALAVSIAEHFRKTGCITVISTHHTALKVYAANAEGVINASVGFDEKTLQPTYQLRVGVPGASAGINIASKLGMNPEIIAAARVKLGTQTKDVSNFLDQLSDEIAHLEKERAVTRQREAELSKEKRRLEAEGATEQKKRVRELEQKLEALLKEFEYQAKQAVNAVQDRAAQQKLSKDAERRIAKARREFKEQFDSALVAHRTGSDRDDPNAKPHEANVRHVSEGDTVLLKSMGRNAKVDRRIEGDMFEVSIGPMKMKVPRSDIAQVISSAEGGAGDGSRMKPAEAARSRGINVALASSDENAPSEINVIGQTVDEATHAVEKFVDRAFLAGLPRVRVVHGSGMGVLRKALRGFLKSHPHVATVTEPPQNEGGAGATVVELRG